MTDRARLDMSFMCSLAGRPARRPLISSVAMTVLCATPAFGQMRALPVLQNAFSSPGISAAVNYGNLSKDGNTIGGAASWTPASAAFQISGGLGRHSPKVGAAALTFGGRVAKTFKELSAGSIALGGFFGAGSFSSSETTVTSIPLGLSAGYRRAFGTSRGVSAYVSPYYVIGRVSPEGQASVNTSTFRVSGGVDVTLARSIGATLGIDGGKSTTAFGIGVTYALGRR